MKTMSSKQFHFKIQLDLWATEKQVVGSGHYTYNTLPVNDHR